MTQVKTSATHPIRIDALPLPEGSRIGMTFCPGKKQPSAMTGSWDREHPRHGEDDVPVGEG